MKTRTPSVIDAAAIPAPSSPDWTGQVVVLAGHDPHRTPSVLRRFLETGAHVVLVSADLESSSRLRAEVQAERPEASVGLLVVDDGPHGDDEDPVVSLGRRLAAIHPRIDVLVHSASLLRGPTHVVDSGMSPRATSAFALTAALAPALHASHRPRVITVVEEDPSPDGSGHPENRVGPYGFGLELHRRLRDSNSHVASIVADPGGILRDGPAATPSAGSGPLMRRFAAQRASYRAEPEVRAAFDAEVRSGDVVTHSRRDRDYEPEARDRPEVVRSRAWEAASSNLGTCLGALVEGAA